MGLGMSAQSGSSDTTSSTQPWAPAIPALTGILGQLNGMVPGAGKLNPLQSSTLDQIEGVGAYDGKGTNANANDYGSAGGNYANNDLAQMIVKGGMAMDYAPQAQNAYDTYKSQTMPLASNTNYDPMSNPDFAKMIGTMKDDITNQVNGSFAGAGRDFSGYNQQALGRGFTQGISPTMVSQWNANRTAQQAAAQSLLTGGQSTSAILAGMQQQAMENKMRGIASNASTIDSNNAGANAILQTEAARFGIPVQQLGMLANIGVPIAGLGSQSQSHTNSSSMGVSGGLKLFSDRRLKKDIAQVGTLFDGTPVYRYRYVGHPTFQIGLMAQDVEQTTPDAVGEAFGYKTVDYKLATEKAAR